MLLLLGLLVASSAGASEEARAQEVRLEAHPESQFWIQGRATGRSFTCGVGRVKGSARLASREVASASNETASSREEGVKAIVRVPVEAFDCGNDRMTRDLQGTLKMEEHPEIRFELVDASIADTLAGTPEGRAAAGGPRGAVVAARWHQIEVLGALTIAGTKRLMRIQATGRAYGEDHFRVRGCKPIRMTYFGIEPPTKAFGLIRVQNRVEAQFDLLAQAEGTTGAKPFDSLEQALPSSCE